MGRQWLDDLDVQPPYGKGKAILRVGVLQIPLPQWIGPDAVT